LTQYFLEASCDSRIRELEAASSVPAWQAARVPAIEALRGE
jgi:hypothetical protein